MTSKRKQRFKHSLFDRRLNISQIAIPAAIICIASLIATTIWPNYFDAHHLSDVVHGLLYLILGWSVPTGANAIIDHYFGLETKSRLQFLLGENAFRNTAKGVISLREERTDGRMGVRQVLPTEMSAPTQGSDLPSPEAIRTLKATHWVNKFDTQGALAIIKTFNELGLPGPTIEMTETSSTEARKRPFEIHMGLYGNKVESCLAGLKFIRLERNTSFGDCIEIKRELFPDIDAHTLTGQSRAEGLFPYQGLLQVRVLDDFIQFHPLPFGVSKLRNPDDNNVRDYAVVCKCTDIGHTGGKKVHVILGGYTEYGTAAAGYYFSDQLRKRGIRDEFLESDFLQVISGHPHHDLDNWQPIDELTFINNDQRGWRRASRVTSKRRKAKWANVAAPRTTWP
jgi:hypothetical protein